jgi:hypothetical protein
VGISLEERSVNDRSDSLRPQHSPIDLQERGEVRYWCRTFGLTYEQLCHVVEAAGTSPAKVSEYLAVPPPAAAREPRSVPDPYA